MTEDLRPDFGSDEMEEVKAATHAAQSGYDEAIRRAKARLAEELPAAMPLAIVRTSGFTLNCW